MEDESGSDHFEGLCMGRRS